MSLNDSFLEGSMEWWKDYDVEQAALNRTYNAEGVLFNLTKDHFIIEDRGQVIVEANKDSDGLWHSNEQEVYSSFTLLWYDVRVFIAEISSSMWLESTAKDLFRAVDALFSTTNR